VFYSSAGLSGGVELTLSRVAVGDVRHGIFGSVTAHALAVSGVLAGWSPASITAGIKDVALADLDPGSLVGLLGGATKADPEPLKTVLRHAASGVVSIAHDGIAVSTASTELSQVVLDAKQIQVALQKLQGATPGAGQRPTRKQDMAAAEAMAAIYGSVGVDSVRVNDFDAVRAAGGRMQFATLQAQELRGGKLANLTISALQGALTADDGPADKLVVGGLTLKGLDLADGLQLPGRLASAGTASPATVWPLLVRLFAGAEVENATLPGPGDDAITIDRLHATLGPVIGQTPTSGELRLRFSMPTSGLTSAGPLAMAAKHGLRRADIRIDGSWNWQEATKTMTVGPVEAAMADVGSTTARLKLTNVSRLALIARPDLLPAAIQAITFGPAELTVRDQGALRMIGSDPAFASERQQLQLRFGAGDSAAGAINGAETTTLALLLNEAARFLAKPNSQLTMMLTPKVPISVGSLLSSGKSGAELMPMLARQIDARATVN
jgi:hypothetical protein